MLLCSTECAQACMFSCLVNGELFEFLSWSFSMFIVHRVFIEAESKFVPVDLVSYCV